MSPDAPGGASDMPDLRQELTAAANRSSVHDRATLDRLLEANYDALRQIAHALTAHEAPGHSVEATGLVHLAYERLVHDATITQRGSVFFRSAFARTARRILVERARARRARKRGGTHDKTEIRSEHLQSTDTVDLLALDEAMTALAAVESTGPRMAAVIEMRVFGDMSVPECAEALGVSPRTIDQDWKLGRGFLQRHLAP